MDIELDILTVEKIKKIKKQLLIKNFLVILTSLILWTLFVKLAWFNTKTPLFLLITSIFSSLITFKIVIPSRVKFTTICKDELVAPNVKLILPEFSYSNLKEEFTRDFYDQEYDSVNKFSSIYKDFDTFLGINTSDLPSRNYFIYNGQHFFKSEKINFFDIAIYQNQSWGQSYPVLKYKGLFFVAALRKPISCPITIKTRDNNKHFFSNEINHNTIFNKYFVIKKNNQSESELINEDVMQKIVEIGRISNLFKLSMDYGDEDIGLILGCASLTMSIIDDKIYFGIKDINVFNFNYMQNSKLQLEKSLLLICLVLDLLGDFTD